MSMIDRMYQEKVERPQTHGESALQEAGQSEGDSEGPGEEEYDPRKPNDYEAVLKERERVFEDERRRVELEDFRLNQGRLESAKQQAFQLDQRQILDDEGPMIDKKIFKMLEKHGWEYGKGIGAEENGILNPLIPVKTSGSTAVIKPLEPRFDAVFSAANKTLIQNPSASEPGPLVPPNASMTVIYQSKPVVNDPRIVPIQEKFFRT